MKTLYRIGLLLAVVVTATVAFAKTSTPRVLILVTSADRFPDGRQTGAWLEEFATPYDALVHAGTKVTVASPKGGLSPIDPHSAGTPDQEAVWKDARKVLASTVPLASVRPADYDAIFIPGGHGPLFDLATDPTVAETISTFARSDKPVASVCHGPAALVGVTLADGKPFVSGKPHSATQRRRLWGFPPRCHFRCSRS